LASGWEGAYGKHTPEAAAELAVHFERGQDSCKAVHYLAEAGEHALLRNAHQEAIQHLTKGLDLLKTAPDTPERLQQELPLQIALGAALSATKGFAAPEAGAAYTRAHQLCRQLEATPHLFSALRGLRFFHSVRGEHAARGSVANTSYG
jgi:predicted ATPase